MTMVAKIKKQAIRLVLFLADWVFPKECVGCGVEGCWLCPDCQTRVGWEKRQTCLVCGMLNKGEICRQHDWFLDKLVAATDYHCSLVKDLIKVCKYRFSQEAADELAELLCCYWQNHHGYAPTDCLVIAVPLSRRRERWRGFNQAAILAKRLSEVLRLNYSAGLIKLRDTKTQVSLSASERVSNLDNCFVWRGTDLLGKRVLLVDDVATTGTTLNECAKVLKAAGAQKVWAIVFAK